jgi:hypothetical protein
VWQSATVANERRPADLDEDERARLRRAHIRLRNASTALEALTASPKQRGRWDPQPPTDEALEGARGELRAAWEAVWRVESELFGERT